MNSLDLTQFQFVCKLPKAGKTILDKYSPNIVIPIEFTYNPLSHLHLKGMKKYQFLLYRKLTSSEGISKTQF